MRAQKHIGQQTWKCNCGMIKEMNVLQCPKCGTKRDYILDLSNRTKEKIMGIQSPHQNLERRGLVGPGRNFAFIIDQVLLIVAVLIVLLLFADLLDIKNPDKKTNVTLVLWSAAVIATIVGIPCLYNAGMESSRWQATLGKLAMGIKVIDLNGNRLSFGRSIFRFFAKYLLGYLLGIGFVFAWFTKRRQALHDIIVGTLVVHK